MAFLPKRERQRIEQAIAEAEGRTAAEFVAVLAKSSGEYLYVPMLAAAAAAFLLSGVLLVVPAPFDLTLDRFWVVQVVLFLALVLLFRWRRIRHRLVPRSVQRDRCRMRAHQVFLDLGLAGTRDRTGVLFFVSAAEHYVEIITDSGIRRVVDDEVWKATVARFTADVRRGEVAEGFLGAIRSCLLVLAEKLPRQHGDANELPNRFVQL